jgi:hypothetical protein
LKLCIAIGLPAAAVISGLAGFALGRR